MGSNESCQTRLIINDLFFIFPGLDDSVTSNDYGFCLASSSLLILCRQWNGFSLLRPSIYYIDGTYGLPIHTLDHLNQRYAESFPYRDRSLHPMDHAQQLLNWCTIVYSWTVKLKNYNCVHMKRRHSAGQHATCAFFVVSDVISSVPKHLLSVTSVLIFLYHRGYIHLLLKDMHYLYAVASTLLHLFMGVSKKARVMAVDLFGIWVWKAYLSQSVK